MSIFNRDLIQREGPGGPGGPPPAPPAPGVTPPAAPPAPAPAAPPPPAAGGEPDYKALYEAERAGHEKTRHEAAGYRVGNKGQIAEVVKVLAKLTGEPAAEGPPDINAQVQALVERDKRRDAELRTLKIDSELKDLFVKHGMHPHTTRSVLIGDGLLEDLDPSSADFAKNLNAIVKDLGDKHENLKVVTPPGTPSKSPAAPMKPNNGGVVQLTRADLAAMKPEEVNEAREKGQLDELLGRKPKA